MDLDIDLGTAHIAARRREPANREETLCEYSVTKNLLERRWGFNVFNINPGSFL